MAHNSKPGAAPAVIRPSIMQEGGDDDSFDIRRLLPAWIISGVIHVVLLSLFLLIYVQRGGANVSDMETTVIETAVQTDEFNDVNLTNDDIGNDPELPTNYDVDRIEEISVPGPVDPNEAVGILNAPEGPPMTVPPPPGFGGGQGGGVDSNMPGRGALAGFAGGLGGPRLTPGGMAGRSGATREKMLQEGGGNSRSEAAVARALKWIVRHQALDGHWGMNDFHVHGRCNCGNPGGRHDVAGTGLGLLPLLGAGETHKGTGRNHVYAKNVERALKWLITHQGANGGFSENGYEHAIATLAICEAYGLTADPWLKGPAQRAINRCVTWQRPTGGFRYRHNSKDEDLSVVAWFCQALKSGAMSGLNVPNATFAGINQYLDSVSDPSGGAYSYVGNRNPSPNMTAAGLLCRQYMGWGPRNPGLAKGIENLNKVPPAKKGRPVGNMYYYYYATQVVHHFGGEQWQKWNPVMRDSLIDNQDQGANPDRRDQKGSWTPQGGFGSRMGRLGRTALCVLTLEVYYRYLPLYKRELGAMKDEAILNK